MATCKQCMWAEDLVNLSKMSTNDNLKQRQKQSGLIKLWNEFKRQA